VGNLSYPKVRLTFSSPVLIQFTSIKLSLSYLISSHFKLSDVSPIFGYIELISS